MRKLYSLLFCILPFAFGAHANEYPQPALEAYGALPFVSDSELSPDGTKVALIANVDGGTRFVVFDLAAGGVSHNFDLGEIKARSVEFYDNDHVILRVSETIRTLGIRNEYEYDAAFSVQLATNDISQLMVRTRDLFPAQSGLGRIVGRADKPGQVLMPAFYGSAYSTPSYNLFRSELDSSRGRLILRGTPDTQDWFIGDGGKILARTRYDNEKDLFRIEHRVGKNWEEIYREEREIPFSINGVMPDESGLIFVRSSSLGDGFDALFKIGFDGEISDPVLPPKDREIESIFTDSNRKIVGVRYAGVEPDYAFLDAGLEASFEAVSDALPDATIYLDSWSDDRQKVLYEVFDATLGEVLLLHTQATNEISALTSIRPEIPNTAVGTMFEITYQARDGLSIQAILTLPPGYNQDTDPPLPTIVMPHGGPAAYDRFDFDWMAQYFANRGYAVLQPNFRGSTGFGLAFERAGDGEWGGKMQDDITDGVKALASSNYIDPNRVCIAGASYGGYAALAGAVFTPELYKCVVAIAPVADLNRMLRDERRQSGKDHWVISYWENVMSDGDARRQKLDSISPVKFAENVQAPVLLLHGDDDTVVPFAQSKAMERALKRADKSVELVRLKGEDHWLSVADTRMQTLREMDRFISEHLPVEN
ncbi:MAG: S9 family peptidase [Pseudomonadota bacterium]